MSIQLYIYLFTQFRSECIFLLASINLFARLYVFLASWFFQSCLRRKKIPCRACFQLAKWSIQMLLNIWIQWQWNSEINSVEMGVQTSLLSQSAFAWNTQRQKENKSRRAHTKNLDEAAILEQGRKPDLMFLVLFIRSSKLRSSLAVLRSLLQKRTGFKRRWTSANTKQLIEDARPYQDSKKAGMTHLPKVFGDKEEFKVCWIGVFAQFVGVDFQT